nr:RNA-directed DNA polymerase, eukaryota [Tanacetum cinerariifolium]GFA47533.1 RNA-directed DNA polymerase, eukaryota [Tanacetum cinerariifolium]
MEEIKTTVWDCGSNKAPRPDGYSFLFIKRFWDLLKHDIQEEFVILIHRFKARLSGWKINLLSIGGRLTLIKSVLGSLGRSKTEFDNLIIDISNMKIDDLVESDTYVWSLFNDDSFSVNSVRKHIDEHSLPSLFSCTRWYKMIPKKVNVFMWRMLLDRLPNRLNQSSRGLDIDSISCMVCNGHVESNDHIFFTCDTAVAIWNLVRSWIDLPLPSFLSCEDWTNWDFCVKDVRNLLDEFFLPRANIPTRWINIVPIKVNISAWKLAQDRLPTRANLGARGVLQMPILLTSKKATCYECRNQGHYKRDYLERKNQNHENQNKSTKARGVVHAFGGGETKQDLNNIEDEIEA